MQEQKELMLRLSLIHIFGYPSGLAWTSPASRQRKALEELMQEYNPRGDSREMNNLSLIHI